MQTTKFCDFHFLNLVIINMEHYSLLLFSHSVLSNFFQPHRLQHTRLPCPSPSPRACSNSCPLSQWSYPTISASSLPTFNLSQHQGLFKWVSSSHQVTKVLELQLQHQSFQWIFRSDFLYHWLVEFPCSPRDSQESSPTPQFNSISSSAFSKLFDDGHISYPVTFSRAGNIFCYHYL